MPDRRLQHVIAVGQAGSFTKAAQTVGMTQSGMTKSIADLERELGYALFHRTAQGALPTERGREFMERASRILEDTRVLLKGEGAMQDPYARVLRIGVSPASLEWLLAEPLSVLRRRHPSLRFDVLGTTFERVIQLLREGSVDVAIGFDEAFAQWSDVRREPIRPLSCVLFVRKDHPLLTSEAGDLRSRLSEYDLISPSESRPYGLLVRDFFETQNVSWRRRLHTIDSFSVMKRLVATSDAVGVTTTEYAASEHFKSVFAVPQVNLFRSLALCFAVRSRSEMSPPVKAFAHVLREVLPPEADMTAGDDAARE